jgi:hypothetical protein
MLRSKAESMSDSDMSKRPKSRGERKFKNACSVIGLAAEEK